MNMLTALGNSAWKSWRTTFVGLMTMITIAWPQIALAIDADPLTAPDWNIVAAAVQVFFLAVVARDNSTTSEQAHAK